MADTLIKLAQNQGPFVLVLFVILGAGLRKQWLFRHQYDEAMSLKEEVIAQLREAIKFRDEQIADRESDLDRERKRADQKEQYAFRILEAAKQAAEVAAAALASRGDKK